MFELIAIPALFAAGILLIIFARRNQAIEDRAQADRAYAIEAEQAATAAWGSGYQAGAAEQTAKLERELAASYDKGFESGWNTCVVQFEDRQEPTQARAA